MWNWRVASAPAEGQGSVPSPRVVTPVPDNPIAAIILQAPGTDVVHRQTGRPNTQLHTQKL